MDLETINLSQICRTCKCVSPHMRSLFEGYESPHQRPRIDEMLMACSSVQVMSGDGLPSQICQICVEQLRSAFVFKSQCEKVDLSLREYAKNVSQVNEIKEELQNSDFIESLNTLSNLLNEQQQSNITKEPTIESTPALVAPEKETDYIQFMDNNQMLLTCRECAKIFTTLEGLRCHKRVHSSGMYKCKQCDKEYTRLNHLQHHEQMHSRRKVHICRICSKILTRMANLKRHLITHLREKPYSCKTCNRSFNRIEHLHSHVPRCKGDTVYPCEICNKAFKREDSLEFHKKTHDNQQPKLLTIENLDNISDYYYQIDQDENVVFSDHSDSDTDDCFEPQVEVMESMHEENIKEVADISNVEDESNISETSAVAAVDDNDSSVDTALDKSLECEETDDKNEVKVEKEIISAPIDVDVDDDDDDNDNDVSDIVNEGVDDDSGDSTDSEYLPEKVVSPKVKRGRGTPRKNPNVPPKIAKTKVPDRGRGHRPTKSIKKEERDEEYGEFPCPACNEMFHTISQLDKHARQQHEGLKVHKCPECNREFTRANHLKRHIKSHSQIKPFQCTVCTKSFNRRDHLNQHQRYHETQKHKAAKHGIDEKIMGENSKEFLCSECGRRFIRKDYLVIHMRRHRGEKPFKCKHCGKGFPRTTDLTVHERYHTGEKTHLCTICGKGFGRAYNLTLHMRTHTGEKPYQCTYCDAAFAQGNDLNTHVRRHTGERFQCELCTESFLMGYLLTQHKRTVHGLNVVGNRRRLLPTHKQENPDDPPPITIPLPKPVVPDNIKINPLRATALHANDIHAQLTVAQLHLARE